jgi:TRAP-type C4-dicarboxylate transport system permease small subunit
MFAAAAGVRDAAHIGMDSLVAILPRPIALGCRIVVQVLTILFAVALVIGGAEMAISTRGDTIPTIGISESFRYGPVIVAGVFVILFAIEHILALSLGKKVSRSWH